MDYSYAGRYAVRRSYPELNVYQDYGYDGFGRVETIGAFLDGDSDGVYAVGGSDVNITQFGYGYDSRGDIDYQSFGHRPAVGSPSAAPVNDFGYDALRRLRSVEYFSDSGDSETFGYDLLGNREEVDLRDGSTDIYAVNSVNNRYNCVGGVSLSYDLAGNLTTDNGGYVYSWDYDNHLTKIEKSGGSGLVTVAEFAYDALGRRVMKIEYITDATGGTDIVYTRYYYSGWQMLMEHSQCSTTSPATDSSTYFAYGNALDEVLFYVTNPGSGESISYLIGDHLNSPAARLDSTGTILERYEYDAYGKRHVFNADYSQELASNLGTHIGFTGQRVEYLDGGSLELCYYKNRWYGPAFGRFLSEDPMLYIDGMNYYEYVSSNVYLYIDPLGLRKRCGGDVLLLTGSFCVSQEEYDYIVSGYLTPYSASAHCSVCKMSTGTLGKVDGNFSLSVLNEKGNVDFDLSVSINATGVSAGAGGDNLDVGNLSCSGSMCWNGERKGFEGEAKVSIFCNTIETDCVCTSKGKFKTVFKIEYLGASAKAAGMAYSNPLDVLQGKIGAEASVDILNVNAQEIYEFGDGSGVTIEGEGKICVGAGATCSLTDDLRSISKSGAGYGMGVKYKLHKVGEFPCSD